MKGTTKPTALIQYGSTLTFLVALHHGGWYWALFILYALCLGFDAYRVSLHEEKHRCGS